MNRQVVIEELNYNEALRYMGQNKEVCDERLMSIIRECEEKILKEVKPRYTYKCFDIEQEEEGVRVSGTALFLKGKSIKEHLRGCKKAVLMCATLSSDIDRAIRVAEHRDMLNAFVMDCLASVAVEQLCDKIEVQIKEDFPEYEMTWRFGVGYGDLPLSLQRDFLNVLNAQKLVGLNVTESCILTPRKSVTAIIGLSEEKIEQSKKGCAICNLKDTCAYRKKGSRCNV